MRKDVVTLPEAKLAVEKVIQLYSLVVDLTFKEIEKLGYSTRGQDGLTLVAVDILNKLKLIENYLHQQEKA